MKLIIQPCLLFAFAAILSSCKDSSKWAIEGDYTVSNTSIFIKNFEAGQESLFGTCGLKKVSIQSHKLYLDSTCEFLNDVKDITIIDSFETTIDKFPIMDRQLFAQFVDGDSESRREVLVFKAREIWKDNVRDSMYIVKKSADSVILVHAPIVLEIVRTRSQEKK
jgi:hypothetical protein